MRGRAATVTVALVVIACSWAWADGPVRLDNPALDGWHAIGSGVWEWRDEAIWCNGEGGGWLRSDRAYSDFTLRFSYKIAPRGNSGVWLRAPLRGRASSVGFEFQIMGNIADAPNTDSTGALYDLFPPAVDAGRPPGEWNEAEITCVGSRVRAVLNGAELYDIDLEEIEENDSLPAGRKPRERNRRGFIGLTNHGAQVWYRNIMIEEHPQPGFRALPLEADLAAWSVRGPAANSAAYTAEDGMLTATAARGSILASDEVAEDYTLRLRYRVSDGAVGRLHLRYDEGNTRYVIAVALADDQASLRYAPASEASGALLGYGAPRYVNSLPAGQWNDLEVVYRGWELSVRLNGNPVLDGSLLWFSSFNGQPRRGAIGIEVSQGTIDFADLEMGPAPEE